MHTRFLIVSLGLFLQTNLFAQQDFNAQQDELLKEIEWPNSTRLCIGITRNGTRLWCIMDQDALDYRHSAPRILAISGLSTESTDWQETVRASQRAVQRRSESGAQYRLAVIPLANPDGFFQSLKSGNGVNGNPATGYPPDGTAYNSATDPERAHLWRFIGWFAPDLVVEVQGEGSADWQRVVRTRSAENAWPTGSLAAALRDNEPIWTGKVPAIRFVTWTEAPSADDLGRLRAEYIGMKSIPGNPFARDTDYPASEIRQEMIRRLDRTPLDVLTQLAEHYGNDLKFVAYQPALAVMCQGQLAQLTHDSERSARVGEILKPYLSRMRPTLEGKYGGSQLAGHLVFAEWQRLTGDETGNDVVKLAADHAFDEQGRPLESMPYHNEMSDAVFMACPILCAAGQLTGDGKYFDMAEKHLDFIQKLCLREDGIYRNSPLCDAAWGRGNGFPALGLTLSLIELEQARKNVKLSDATKNKAAQIHARMQRDLQTHLGALMKFQDLTGMWQQVIDEPGSYRELTCTCMIGYGISEGIQRGWLSEAEFGPVVRRAWEGVKLRIGSDGKLIDVCTGTGKQESLRDYLDRTAILGSDERGGAMAMMFATTMATWEATRKPQNP